MEQSIIIIGAGLTGLSAAYSLKKHHVKVTMLEKTGRIGGQIHTFHENGFIFESGPNTGVVSHPEVTEMFNDLEKCKLETAHQSAAIRLIWKGNSFHPLPSGPLSAISTPLFSLYDKFRILGEPFRSKGVNPDESVGDLAKRRLGKSFVDYAVDPFIGGVYAGNPYTLTARYAMPKLYNLEQNYGSFIKGAIKKHKEPKTQRDKLATKKVFSAVNGLENMVLALGSYIGNENIITSALDIDINPTSDNKWKVKFNHDGIMNEIIADGVITTCGSYELPSLLKFIDHDKMDNLNNLFYAPIVQASVGVKNIGSLKFNAFGGLVPSIEKREVLGILYPSCCFDNRAPENGALFSFFIGGARNPEYLNMNDDDLTNLIDRNFHSMLGFAPSLKPDLIRIFRHEKAIPQYTLNSGKRFSQIENIEKTYPGLVIGGNLRNGIGMADRIKQGSDMAQRFLSV